MAFLCPARAARKVKKRVVEPPIEPPLPIHNLGRITGSASIDTIDRAGLERDDADNPTRRRVILQDFKACHSGELNVSRHQHVKFLYQEHNWNYVKDEIGAEGYVPKDICAPLGNRPSMDDMGVGGMGGQVVRNKHYNSIRSAPAMPFSRVNNTDNVATGSMGLNRFNGQRQSVGAPDLIKHVRQRTAMALTPAERQLSNQQQQQQQQSPEDMWHQARLNRSDESENRTNSYSISSKELPSFSRSNLYSSQGLQQPLHKQPQSRSNHTLNNTSHSSPHSIGSPHNSSTSSNPTYNEHSVFVKMIQGSYFVKFNFRSTQENDVSVQRGFFVTLLNQDDPDWYWVMTANRQEGFVPANYLLRADCSTPTEPISGQMDISGIPMSPFDPYPGAVQHMPLKNSRTHNSFGDFHSTPQQPTVHRSVPHHRSMSDFNRRGLHESPTDIAKTIFPHSHHESLLNHVGYTDEEFKSGPYMSQEGYASRSSMGKPSAPHRHGNRNTEELERNITRQYSQERYKSGYNPNRDVRYHSSDHARSRNQSLSPTRRRKESSEHELKSRERLSRHDQGRYSLTPQELQQKSPNSRAHSSHSDGPLQQNSHNSRQPQSAHNDFNVSFGKEINRDKKNLSISSDRLNTPFGRANYRSYSDANKLRNIRAEVDQQKFIIRSKSTEGINRVSHLSPQQKKKHHWADQGIHHSAGTSPQALSQMDTNAGII